MFAIYANRESRFVTTSHTNMNFPSNFLRRCKARLAPFRRWMQPMLVPLVASLFASTISIASAQTLNEPSHSLELSRSVRPWEFLPLVGRRAALFGDESGHMEAWVYPLKFLREFHLQFHEGGRVVPAESLARTVIVHPEWSTIVYSGDTFTVRETLFVPVNEPGAVIVFDDIVNSPPIEQR